MMMRKTIVVLCVMVFMASCGYLAHYFVGSYMAVNELKSAARSSESEDIRTDKGTVIAEYAGLWRKNHDAIGWIRIDGTKIDFPVMQTKDSPEFYLRRNLEKEYSREGVPFMDASSDIFMPTSNYMIYGHNMKSGAMFHDLIKFKDEKFHEKHKLIRFDTIYKESCGIAYPKRKSGGQGEYRVVSAAYSRIYPKDSSAFKYYKYAGMCEAEEFREFVRGIKSEALYETGIYPEPGQQLITLSTCTNDENEGRFYVVAVRVD